MNKIDISYTEIKKLNAKLLTDDFLFNAIDMQFNVLGIQLNKSVVYELIPEGNNSYTGKVIRQDGQVFQFDLDLDDKEYTVLDKITDEFNRQYKMLKNSKPWAKEVVSLTLFKELSKE